MQFSSIAQTILQSTGKKFDVLHNQARNVGNSYPETAASPQRRGDAVIGLVGEGNAPSAGRVIFPFFFLEAKKEATDVDALPQLARYMVFGLEGLATMLGTSAKCYGATLLASVLNIYRIQFGTEKFDLYQILRLDLMKKEDLITAARFLVTLGKDFDEKIRPCLELFQSQVLSRQSKCICGASYFLSSC